MCILIGRSTENIGLLSLYSLPLSLQFSQGRRNLKSVIPSQVIQQRRNSHNCCFERERIKQAEEMKKIVDVRS